MEDIVIKINGKEHHAKVEETEDGRILVHCNGDVFEVNTQGKKASIYKPRKKETDEKGKSVVTAPLPGTVYEVKVKKGDKVKEGQSLIKLIAMKMENDITAPKSGTIKDIKVKKNDNVNKDDVLAIIE